ncbi:polysaccharide deacetylase family protein [Clostridium sp. SHJSY1]|uniref:polysaccharide deacetylase family protein n=1 Tax=Clostridium sp. SHJSY1 TaxID=2942483 RepID=UPI00287669D8|nr:polysaccharide deacetylase family protein [Clostridium sp. SHJSY1]MDS0528268.1 polysaccharide deacetylase family protein [Clostridium sp. SHJSY1]
MFNRFKNKKYLYPFCAIAILFICLLVFILVINHAPDKKTEVSSTLTTEETETPKEAETQKETESTPKIKDRFEGIPLTNEDVGIPVLYYHSVLPDSETPTKNEVTISPEKLKEELKLVQSLGYTTLTISEVNDYIINKKPIPQKSILITFDDGYTDNYVHAFPILKELNMKATIFVISSGIDSGYYMSKDQLKEMSDYGIDIESHTVNHVHLNTLSYEEQLKELKDSKAKIESVTNKPVLSIAYPFGDFNENSKKAAKDAGYSLAFTTNLGLSNRTDNPVALDRIYVSSEYSLEMFKDRLLNTKK